MCLRRGRGATGQRRRGGGECTARGGECVQWGSHAPSTSANRTAGFLGGVAASSSAPSAVEPAGAGSGRCCPPLEAGKRLRTERGRASPTVPAASLRAPLAWGSAPWPPPCSRDGESSPAPSRRTSSVRRSAASTTGPRSSALASTASMTRASRFSPRATADRRLWGAPATGGGYLEARSVHDASVRVSAPSVGASSVRDQCEEAPSWSPGADDCACGDGDRRFIAAPTEAATSLSPPSGRLADSRPA